MDALRELSDERTQRALWTASEGPDVSSFEECVCRLYDDSGLDRELDRGSVYSPDVDEGLRRLGGILAKVDAARTPEEVLADPLITQVRFEATDLLHRLNILGYEES